MADFRVFVKRSRSDTPPDSLDFGELAFSDLDNRLHIGKHDGSIHSFEGGDGSSPHTHDGYAASDHTHTDLSPTTHPPSIAPPDSPIDGDTWAEIDANGYPVETWFWDNTRSLWLSVRNQALTLTSIRRANTNTSYSDIFRLFIAEPFLILSWTWQYYLGANCDATNYFEIGLVEIELDGIGASGETRNSIPFILSTQNDQAGLYAEVVPASHQINTNASIGIDIVAIGSPPASYFTLASTIKGRWIRA